MSEQADLRTFLNDLRMHHPELLMEIEEEVALDYSSTALALALEKRGQGPVLLFNQIGDQSIPLLANIFASRTTMALGACTTESNFYQHFGECLDRLLPAEVVKSGPVHEIIWQADEVDLAKLPIPKHFDDDAGPYITAGMVAARDPETGVSNLAYARLQIKGPRKMGISIHSRQHLWDYFRRAEEAGVDLDVAVVIGAHPAVMLAAAAKMGINEDEYDLAGALMGTPLTLCKGATVDIDVPTHAEIVIEGKMLAGQRETEGPFGEYTGYTTGRSTDNVFEVSAITMRKDATFVDIIPGNSKEHLTLGRASKEAWVYKRMKEALPFFVDFHFPDSGTHFHCYLRIDKSAEGQAKQAAMLLMGLDHYVKLVIVVDKDIDPCDQDAVLWATAMRMQADQDVEILSGVMGNRLDPSSADGLTSKMIVDATEALDSPATRVRLPEEDRARAEELIANLSGN
jgi:2,5-furandicarboxylate decarboxylase 1